MKKTKKMVETRIELHANAKATLEKLRRAAGMTEVSMMSRLIEWFVHQDEPMRNAALRNFPPEIEAAYAKLIVTRMIRGKA